MRPTRSIALITSLVILVAACAGQSPDLGTVPPVSPTVEPSVVPGSPDATPGDTPTPSTPTTSPTVAPTGGPGSTPVPTASPAGTTIVRAYFYLDGEQGSAGLVGTLHEVPETKGVARAAMTALLAGRDEDGSRYDDLTSAIPFGTRLLGLSIADRVATVDLSSEFESGGGSLSALVRIGQVVYTLTQFSNVDAVQFWIEGKPVSVVGPEGIALPGPVDREDYVQLLPVIFVDRPVFGAAIGNPARVTGSTDVFEATFRLTLIDGRGRTLVDEMVMADCGSGCRGSFDVTLRYDVADAQWGILRAWNGSAVDGSPDNVREYPVWLTPAR